MRKDNRQINNKIELTIIDLVANYVTEDRENIIGIYMIPYMIGHRRKIELTIITNKEKNNLTLQSKRFDWYEIISNVHSWGEYLKENDHNEVKESLQCDNKQRKKDLKNGIILYDPKHQLENRKNSLEKEQILKEFYNKILLSNNFQEQIISKVNTHLENHSKRKKLNNHTIK